MGRVGALLPCRRGKTTVVRTSGLCSRKSLWVQGGEEGVHVRDGGGGTRC